ncbi:MAG: hypothetical protein OXD30_04430 [Bryobacterales bacterium]|nr:hypothetical protein [Bryobacterales bacterium]
MPNSETACGPDSRPARREALEAGLLWALALVATVGLSTWLGSVSGTPVWGVPRWAALGVFAPWLLFFLLHVRFCRKRT